MLMFAATVGQTISSVHAAQSDVIDTSRTASLTIHKYDMTAAQKGGVDLSQFTATGKQDAKAEEALKKYPIKGVEFSYLRVGDVEQQSEAGKVQMIYELPDALQKILGLADSDAAKTEGGKDYFTSQIINDKLASALEDNTASKDKLEDYMKTNNGTAMDLTDAQGVTKKDKLPLGLYLIVETKVPEDVTYTTNPWFVQLPSTDSEGDDWFYDVVCYPKNETGIPTLDKRVRNNPDQDNVTTAEQSALADFTNAREEYKYQSTVTASKAEKLDYQFISKLPHITSGTTYLSTYTFDDKMAKGMTYNKNAVIAIYENKDAADTTNVNNVDKSGAIAVWKSSDTDPKFAVTYGKSGEDSTMKVEMTKSGLNEINKKYSDKYIVVYYTADVNTDDTVVLGDKGNPNDVSLTWKRTSTDYWDILKDKCIVYSFGYNFTKKFSDNKGDATKVKFVIQNKSDNYYLVARADRAGVYQITGKSATEEAATQFSPDAGGKLVINGIEADVLAVLAILLAQRLIPPELLDLFFQIFPVTALKQFTGLTNLNQFRDAADVRSQHRCAIHLGFHYGERAVLIPLRRVDREACLTDELFQCLAFLEANVLDVLNTIYCLFQRTSAGEDELYIRQFLTDLD